MKISFVIPCYRSEKTIEAVIEEIEQVVAYKSEYAYEIILVNDCSPDNLLSVLHEITERKRNVRVVNFMRNFGQQSAIMAGLNRATGDYIVGLDDDGQCPMEHLWDLLEPLAQGHDMSIAKYPRKEQSNFKNFGSKVNSIMTHVLLEMPKDIEMSNFYAITSNLCQEIIKYRNAYPYLTGLVFRATKDVVNVPMLERKRVTGTTGYTFSKLLSVWMNGFTNFSVKPLRIAAIFGLICAMIGFVFGSVTVVRKLVNPEILAGYASIVAAIFFVGGILMILLGLIGEYIGRIFICINQSPQYTIREEWDSIDSNL